MCRRRAFTDTDIAYGERELSTAAPSTAGDDSECELVSEEELLFETDDEGSEEQSSRTCHHDQQIWASQPPVPTSCVCWQLVAAIPTGCLLPSNTSSSVVNGGTGAGDDADHLGKKNRRRSAFVAKKREERALRRAQRNLGITARQEVIVENLPEHVTVEAFQTMLDAEGFQGLYNCVKISQVDGGCLAVVNMMSPHVAVLAMQLLPLVTTLDCNLKVRYLDDTPGSSGNQAQQCTSGPPGTWL